MKKFLRCIALILLLSLVALLPAAQAETTLRLNGFSKPEAFCERHPEVAVSDTPYHYYGTTGELNTDMVLGSFDADVFRLNCDAIDCSAIMEKGYCLDLSSSEIIRDAIANLYPVFADQCVKDGKIYAIPTGILVNYQNISFDVLEETDFGEVELPDTFPEFLDFVERWVDYLEDNSENISLYSIVKDDFYNEQTYTTILVEWLLDNHIMQKAYAGQPLRFNEPEVVELLKRCYELGHRLYENEQMPTVMGTPSILRPGGFLFDNYQNEDILYLRLNENQPRLISTYLEVAAVYAGTKNPDLSIELVEDILQDLKTPRMRGGGAALYLYQDSEPVLDPEYDEGVTLQQQFIQNTMNQLANADSEADRLELEDDLERKQAVLQSMLTDEDEKYIVSPGQLDYFRSRIGELCILKPGVFNPNDEETAKNFKQLKGRFAAGLLSAEELVTELDRVAQMIELEQGE